MAIRHGASALGLVSHMPSGPGVIADELIAEISASVPPPIATFLLTASCHADGISAQHAICRTTAIQLVDAVELSELKRLRRALPHVKLVQVIHVQSEASVSEAREVSSYMDALLLDSGDPSLQVKELGGTGRVHDWQISRRIREESTVPVFLAGGLRASNISDAVAAVQPFGLDLCSSVRVGGHLDEAKLDEFMRAVQRNAAPPLHPIADAPSGLAEGRSARV